MVPSLMWAAPGSRVPWPPGGLLPEDLPRAEAIVRAAVQKAVRRDTGLGAGLIRMLLHDCFVEVSVRAPMAGQMTRPYY